MKFLLLLLVSLAAAVDSEVFARQKRQVSGPCSRVELTGSKYGGIYEKTELESEGEFVYKRNSLDGRGPKRCRAIGPNCEGENFYLMVPGWIQEPELDSSGNWAVLRNPWGYDRGLRSWGETPEFLLKSNIKKGTKFNAAHWLDLVARVLLFRLLFYTKM